MDKKELRKQFHLFPIKEIEKFFSKIEDKAYNIHTLISDRTSKLGDEFLKNSIINVKGIFHLHSMYTGGNKWLLDQAIYSIPCFDFDLYKASLARAYFRDTSSYNGNLRYRPDTDFNYKYLAPMIVFNVNVKVYSTVVEDLFRSKSTVHDICFEDFFIEFSFTDSTKYNRFLRHKYKEALPYFITNEFTSDTLCDDKVSLSITSCELDALEKEEIETPYPISCWKNLKAIKESYVNELLIKYLGVYDIKKKGE